MKRRSLIFLMTLILVFGAAQFGVTTAKAADSWDGTTVDTSWYNTTDASFTITTGAQLAGLAKLVNTGDTVSGGDRVYFTDVTITLSDDIDLGGHEWTPIGNDIGYFDGTFDGDGHTISNLAIGTSASPQSTLMYIGLFGYTYWDSIIQNLDVETTGIYSSYNGAYVGVLVGDEMGIINDCSTAGTVSGDGDYSFVGGLAGTSEGDIAYCSSGVDVVCGTDSFAGGLVGQKVEGVLIGCHATGNVSDNATNGNGIGGLVGWYASTGALSNCYATGDVACSGYEAGGFIGYIDQDTSVSGCYATGEVTASGTGACAGGFAGYSDGTLNGCFATGNVQSSGNGDTSGTPFPCCVGGFVGYTEHAITRCFASSNVTNTGSYVAMGGFAGLTDDGTIENCYAAGSVAGGNHDICMIGGFIGHNDKNIQSCYARGTVSGSGTGTYVGGFAGRDGIGATFGNCYFDTLDSGLTVGIGYSPDSLLTMGLTPDKLTGSSASGNMTDLSFPSVWTTKANDSKWYFPQLAVFSGSSNDTIKALSLASVTLTPFTVTFNTGSGSAVASEYGYYTAIGEPTDPTRSGHFFEGWYTTSGLTSAYNFSTAVTADITLFAKWTALTLSSSDADGTIYSGGRVTLTPSKVGGAWTFDSAFFSRKGNTFTALKAGTSTITYTVDGVSTAYGVTIVKSNLPATGQDFTWAWVLCGAALAALTAATWVYLKKTRKSQNIKPGCEW